MFPRIMLKQPNGIAAPPSKASIVRNIISLYFTTSVKVYRPTTARS